MELDGELVFVQRLIGQQFRHAMVLNKLEIGDDDNQEERHAILEAEPDPEGWNGL